MALTIFSDAKIITFHFRTVEIDKIKLLAEKSVKFIFNLAAILPFNIVRELAIDCTALTRDHLTIPDRSQTVMTEWSPRIPAFEGLHSYLVFDQSNGL